jgi:hypothetical protein
MAEKMGQVMVGALYTVYFAQLGAANTSGFNFDQYLPMLKFWNFDFVDH